MAFKKYTQGKVNYYFDAYECQCSSSEHIITFKFDNNSKDWPPELFGEIHLCQSNGFFKRLWHAVKFVFGYKSKYGNFDTFIFKPEDLPHLRNLFDEFEKAQKIYPKNLN